MKLYLKPIISLLLLTSLLLASNPAQAALSARVETQNKTKDINDGKATIVIKNGVPPYQYLWPIASVGLDQDSATGIIEGIEHSVTVVDATMDTISLSYKINASSMSESINSFFKPIVDIMASIMFRDPFELIGVYDPTIYDEAGNPVLNPNGTPKTQGIPFVVFWLVMGGIFFTFRMKFVNVWGIRHALELVRGKYDHPDDPGEVTHFQALTTALSATVGLGNIAGVAVAISIGGAGATFWMIVAGLLGMTLKFAECTLGVKYRDIDEDGTVYGGPMAYLNKAFTRRNMGAFGKVLAFMFAVLCVGGSFGGGNMFQSNQAFAQVSQEFAELQGMGAWFGLAMAVLVGVVIIGGIKSIAKVTDKIVPFMVGLYVVFALIIIFMHIDQIDEAFAKIFNGAFSPSALKGGALGVLIVGFQRAAFSNEAGVGSASIAHSAAKTNEPVSEGLVALFEPFVDTVVVCTMTALVLIFTDRDGSSGLSGAQLTSAAFSEIFPWFRYVLMVAIVLFAFSTMISWSYYGQRAWNYLFGHSQLASGIYKGLFLFFTVVGAATGLGAVLDFSDMMILGMAFPNVLGLLILNKEVREDMVDYFKRLRAGEIKKVKD